MMQFAVFGLPRSGTTWAANWLSADGALCLHDPIAELSPDEIMRHDRAEPWGVSCTGLWLFKAREIAARAPVVILENDPDASNAALVKMGLQPLPDWMHARFSELPGLRVRFTDLWHEEGARRIWSHLRPGAQFDLDRWRMLKDIQVQPFMDRMTLCGGSAAAFRRLYLEQARGKP